MSTFTNVSKTWSAFSQKPTFLARMGSSYITPHILFCPGAYLQLSKPYHFGTPTSFYSLLLVPFLSWLYSSGFIHVWSPPCHTARHVFRWHWIHLILVLLHVLRWHSLAKRIVADLPHAPFCHAKNPLISWAWLKWYSNDKVMSHACLRFSHNSLTRSQVPKVFNS